MDQVEDQEQMLAEVAVKFQGIVVEIRNNYAL